MSRAPTPPVTAIVAWLGRAFAFAVVAFGWWRISENTADNDLWGHVLYGQRMLHLGALETTETLSWTAAGLPWINHEVLAELALGFVHRIAGGSGLWALMMIMAGVTLGWAWHGGTGTDRVRRFTGLALLALCANFIALGYAVRPQLFTYFFFVALVLGLRRFFSGQIAWGFIPPALLLVWVNTHGGFLAGWAVIMLAVGAELVVSFFPDLQRRLRDEPGVVDRLALISVAVTSTLVLVANPWGWKLVFWTIETLRLPRPTILEWQPMPFTAGTLPFYFVILLGALAWIVSRRPRRVWEMAVWLLLAVLSVRHQRHAPLFGLASLIFLPLHLQDMLARLAPHAAGLRQLFRQPVIALGATFALLMGGGWCLRQSTAPARVHPFRMAVPRDLFPVSAIEYMRAHQLTGNTVTFFDWGQQVLWELPNNPVSFDGRLDTVYPPDVMAAHWRLYAGQDPGLALDLSQARVALLPTGSASVSYLLNRQWAVVYVDPLAAVVVRPATDNAKLPALTRGGETTITGSVPFPDDPPVLASRAQNYAAVSTEKITGETVRDDFNAINTVLHYTRAAHFIGLWKSEVALIEKYLPDRNARLLEAGCGAGRVAVGLWHQGYRHLTAFDFAGELIEQAQNLAREQGIAGITFLQADATGLTTCHIMYDKWFDGALFLFNGMMQIPGRENRRAAMRELQRVCRPGAHFIFSTHDREDPKEAKAWVKEAARWAKGEQNPRLLEFGDRYFTDENGNTFMHLPDRREVLEDMAATGWTHVYDATRNELASETPKVRNFSDNCRFWVARKA